MADTVENFGVGVPTAVVVFDKPRTLRLNMAAQLRAKKGIRDLRKLTGAPEREITDYEVFTGGLEASTALVWGCLLHEDPDLKVITVAEWLHHGNLARVNALLERMVAEYLPEASGDPLAEGEVAAE